MMRQQRSKQRTRLDTPIIEHIQSIKSNHPFWGCRRVWAYMRDRDGIIMGKNRVYRLMKKTNLTVTKNRILKTK